MDEPRERWAIWFRRLGIDDIDPWRGPGFSHSNMVIQAAVAGQGVAVWMITSDMEELLGMSDRVAVMHEGRIAGELSRAELSEERVMTLATGGRVA